MGRIGLPFLLFCICIAGQLPGRAHSSIAWPPPHAASTSDGGGGGSPGFVDVDSVAVDGGQYQRSAVLGAKLEEAVAKQLADEARLAEKKSLLVEKKIHHLQHEAEKARAVRDPIADKLESADQDANEAREELHVAEAELDRKEAALERATQVSHLPEEMLKNMDISSDPCRDFFQYACGRYNTHAEIPEYLISWSHSWDETRHRTVVRMVDVLEKDEGDAGSYFQSCMDTEAVEELGTGPLKIWMEAVDEVKDRASLTSYLATTSLYNMAAIFSWQVKDDLINPGNHYLLITHASLSLPGPSYFLKSDKKYVSRRENLVQKAAEAFEMTGMSSEEAQQEAQDMLEVETEVARNRLTYHQIHAQPTPRMRTAGLLESCGGIDWELFFEATGMSGVTNGTAEMGVEDLGNLEGIQRSVFEAMPYSKLRGYLRWRLMRSYSSYLPRRLKLLVEESRTGHVKTVKEESRPKRPQYATCYMELLKSLPEETSRLYLEQYFDEGLMDEVAVMLTEVRQAFAEELGTLEWMDPESKAQALSKLEMMGFEVGYPDDKAEVLDEGELGMKPHKRFDNYLKVQVKLSADERRRLYEKIDTHEWAHPSIKVNAYYNRQKNTLYIPAGVLQKPFFASSYPSARKFGALGSILGHEMSHGFDNKGSLYDGKGIVHNWWDPNTLDKFKERTRCISHQFGGYEFQKGEMVDGELTLGETIADSGGIRMSYRAFNESYGGEGPADEERKLFFLSFAQMWCAASDPRVHHRQGVHPPKKWRVIGTLQDSEQFAEAYNCPAGSFMNPTDKCVVW